MLEAAANGLGLALAKASLVQGDLAAHRLVQLGDTQTQIELAYFIVYPPDRAGHPAATAFRKWIAAEIAESATPTPVATRARIAFGASEPTITSARA